MGVQLKEVIEWHKINFDMLGGNRIAIDAFNTLYQFITIIRQRDGTPLMDSRGRVTSHLSGMLYRTAKIAENGVKPVYVFDGDAPDFKLIRHKRREAKEAAGKKLKEARAAGDTESVRKYSTRTAKLEDYMIKDAKKLLTLMGVPWVQAPSEGEAQVAYMAKKGDVWGAASQDYDALLFGAPKLIRNMTMSGRRKLPYKNVYVEVVPELIKLDEVVGNLGITKRQLICMSMLIGTDFNPGGIKGVGPKTALDMIRKDGCDALKKVKWDPQWPEKETIIDFFENPPTTDDYKLEWGNPDTEKLLDFMVGEHDFSESRVLKAVDHFKQGLKKGRQTGLGEWFG
ncbi:MAG: flap endonuclease-1 [Candidatus Altiarchaeota archaeon]|nr:flap endonuclease-1 [Candidatus Altiarchaeota archaeon]